MRTITAAIEQLYSAFAIVAKPSHIEGCSHCLNGDEIQRLLARPLRSLTPEDLSPYAASAFLTVGKAADYLYFLPRILDISATEESWWPDPEVTGRCIRSAGPGSWNNSQREALVEFNRAVIESAIASASGSSLDSWLCAIDRMGFDVRPYLQQISNDRSAILALFDINVSQLPHRRLANAFWELPSTGHDAIVDWFYSAPIRRVPFETYGFVL